ncbi:ABC transporter ATP-binding protein [Pelagibius sp. 7325]|uniref:ABC transporter ATP-binding protein n=1 Tax=Pelagibius sp. 7325 TaxID=3131994 RepID=UPI0030ED1C05
MNATSKSRSPVLEIRDLQVSLPTGGDRLFAIDGVSLDLHEDEILCIVGESGSGKSMMARAIMGLLPGPMVFASNGEVRFEGNNLLAASPAHMRDIRGSRIAMIFQEPMTALNPLMTIGQQIDEVLRIHTKLDRAARRQRVLAILADVHLPDPETILSAFPHQLSGGQRQRAMIAMALILEPRVIIADEPTTALDVTTQAQILQLIKEIQRKHKTGVIFITHDFSVVAEIADRVAVMQGGGLVELGKAADILNRPQQPYTKALIAAVPSLRPRAPSVSGRREEVLQAVGLSKTFSSGGGLFGGRKREVKAVQDVNLTLRRGETIGIVGESGSGKSTLARLIIRLIQADKGEVLLHGTDFLKLNSRQVRSERKRIQMVFQDPFASLNPRYKVGHIIAEGMLLRGTPKIEACRRVNELLDLVGLDRKSADRFPHEFSGGQRQRIGVARALALDPEILIADEAVSALDVSVQAQVLRLLADIRDRLNLSMLFITHDLCVAAQVCDHIMVMRRGEVVESGATAEVFAAPKHDYTKALFKSIPGRSWIAAKDSVL